MYAYSAIRRPHAVCAVSAEIGGLLEEGFWALDHSSRDVDEGRVVEPAMEGEAIHESDSDACLRELLGTG